MDSLQKVQLRRERAREIAAAALGVAFVPGSNPTARAAYRALDEANWQPPVVAAQARQDAILAEAREVVALREFKESVTARLDNAGVPESGNLNDRLDLALAGYVKPVDPDLLAARQLAYAALLDFAKKAKYPHNTASRYARAEATRRGDHDSGPLVQDMLRAFKAGKAAK